MRATRWVVRRKAVWIAALALLCLPAAARAGSAETPATVCNPVSYGARADGKTMDTAAIQHAIDACASHGGVVDLSHGVFLTAPIVLRSHVHLRIHRGATLLGSPNIGDYPILADENRRQPLITSEGAEDIAITGHGIIDGQGASWWSVMRADKAAHRPEKPRPWLIELVRSHHILIENVTLRNSPMYNLVPHFSSDVVIRNITILNPANAPNTDGIDPFSSSRVTISHVTIDTGDDDIAIKSGLARSSAPNPGCTDITIRDSTFLHGHGLSIGSESAGPIRDVLAENIHFRDTRNGIRIKSNRGRGSQVTRIAYRNITMENVGTPILITEYYPKIPATDAPQPIAAHTPDFQAISIRGLQATGASQAGWIVGLPERPLTGVSLEQVTVHAQTGLVVRNATVHASHLVIVPVSGPPLVLEENARTIGK